MSGVPVTVDSDDLEALLFATGAIKAIEGALQEQKRDPLVTKAKAKLTGAHDRAANAWRGALRQAQYPERFRDPSEDETQTLLHLHEGPICLRSAPKDHPYSMAFWRPLMVLGFVEFGTEQNVIVWSSSGEVTHGRPAETFVRLTPRGLSACEAAAEQRALGSVASLAATGKP